MVVDDANDIVRRRPDIKRNVREISDMVDEGGQSWLSGDVEGWAAETSINCVVVSRGNGDKTGVEVDSAIFTRQWEFTR